MIVLPAEGDDEVALWHALFDLAERTGDWTLIGARMVQLHAAASDRSVLRTSLDGDVLADARTEPNAVRRVAEILLAEDFRLEEPSYMGVGHTFVKGNVQIDLLAPEHLDPHSREARTTVPGAHTVEVPGGRQALARTQLVAVRIGRREGACHDRTCSAASSSRLGPSTSTMFLTINVATWRCSSASWSTRKHWSPSSGGRSASGSAAGVRWMSRMRPRGADFDAMMRPEVSRHCGN